MRLIGVLLGLALAIKALAYAEDEHRTNQTCEDSKPVCLMNLHVDDCKQHNAPHQSMVMIRGQLLPVPD